MILASGSLKSFFERYKKECLVFLLSLIAQTIFFAWLLIITETPNNLVSMTGDASAYKTATENIINRSVYSLSAYEPYPPDSFRSPGYVFFLTPIYLISGNWQVVLILQSFLYALIPVLIYLIGKQIHEKSAYIASIIFAVEPTRLFLSNSLLTDSLFTLLLLLFIFYLFRFLYVNNIKNAILIGFLLGLATLVRPISMFLPAFVVILIIIKSTLDQRVKDVALPLIIFVLVFLSVLFPWSLRNKINFDSWQISSIGSYNLLYYNVTEFLKYRDGDVTDLRLEKLFRENKDLPYLEQLSLSRSDIHSSLAKEILLEDSVGYIKFHIIKTIPFFVTDGLREIARTTGVLEPQVINISTLFAQGKFIEIFDSMRKSTSNSSLFLLGFTFWSLITISIFLAFLITLWRKRLDRYQIITLFFIILYFALLTGPVSSARYRLPVSGLMIFLSVFSFYLIFYINNDSIRKI